MSAGGTETATPRKTTLGQEILSLSGYLLAVAAFTFFVIGLVGSWLIVLLVAIYPLSRFGATLVHEIGHAVGALLVGWRIAVVTATFRDIRKTIQAIAASTPAEPSLPSS